jgi:hypothetical protein
VSSTLRLDLGVAWFSVEDQFPTDTVPGFLVPDAGFLFTSAAGPVHPYAGGGVGLVADLRRSSTTLFAMHAAAGLMIDVTDRWGLRIDARIREIGSGQGSSRELTIGVTRRLGDEGLSYLLRRRPGSPGR